MIRTAYPVLPVNKFRLQWERATRRTRGALEERCRSLRSGGPELPHGPDNALPDTLQARYDSLRFQNVAYREFEERFDRLVGLICVAAQEGITPEREAAYREQRRWFITGYSRVRPFVSGFLTPCISDRAPGLWRQRPCDAFEALFLPSPPGNPALRGRRQPDNPPHPHPDSGKRLVLRPAPAGKIPYPAPLM